MYKQVLFILIFSSLVLTKAKATAYFVSPTGKNTNSGTFLLPFKTITYALTKAKNPGDTVYLRAGTYRELATFPYSGTATAPITLTAYNGENAIISGTDVYNALSWTPTSSNPSIFQASYTGSSFEQLFYNNKPMVQARWPNLPKDKNGDWNFWDSTMWASAGNGSAYGTIVDAALANSGLDATGALAVLNVNHQYYVWTRPVLSHTAGSPSFTYAKDLGTSIGTTLPYNDDKYYLIGKKEFLDAPGEWFNDTINHILYFYPPDGQNPNLSGGIEIKTRNYSLKATAKLYLNIQNITFWGTAFQFNSFNSGCDNLVFKNNTILFSSWTEYFSVPAGQTGNGYESNYPVIYANNCQVSGNTFAFGALSSLMVSGLNNLIENNTIHDFNVNSSLVTPLLQVARTWDSYIGKAGNAIIRFNELYNSGGVVLEIGQSNNNVYYNHIHHAFLSCYGGNKDQSMVYTNCQTNSSSTAGTRFHHNWIHDGYAGTVHTYWGGGEGIRGDDRTSAITVDHNVIWNVGSTGIEIKSADTPTISQANRAVNNLSFNNSRENTIKASLIMESQTNLQNQYSSFYNNVGKGYYGAWNGLGFKFLTLKGNNYDNLALPLEDTTHFDFRPILSSPLINAGKLISDITTNVTDGKPDLGPYERGDSTYWIPGLRINKTSFPIIPDSMKNVPVSRNQLMWKPAYNAISNRIYFGLSPTALSLQGITSEEKNVFFLPALSAGTTYYWRVDAVMTDSSVSKGDVWSFTTAGTLPVQLINFYGNSMDKANELKWETANENNLKGFEVQRLTSLNTWKTIGIVVPNGNDDIYSFIDYLPFVNSQYRIMVKNEDGSESFSKVISIQRNEIDAIKVWPNPTANWIHVLINNSELFKTKTIKLFSPTGNLLFNRTTTSSEINIEMLVYSKGLYFIEVEMDGKVYRYKTLLK